MKPVYMCHTLGHTPDRQSLIQRAQMYDWDDVTSMTVNLYLGHCVQKSKCPIFLVEGSWAKEAPARWSLMHFKG